MVEQATRSTEEQRILKILHGVADPEIPVISVVDLGIVRDIRVTGDSVEIDITPTYSGCPALDVIPILIKQALEAEGYSNVQVENVLSPPWTTDWISEEGLKKLKVYGIAPPVERTTDPSFQENKPKIVPCPRCDSTNTSLVSRFASTPCKAAYRCDDCLEPFEYFKCH